MKIKLLWVGFLSIFILFGCTNTNQEGLNDMNNRDGNIEQTRYNDGINKKRTNNNRPDFPSNDNRMNNRNDNMSNNQNNNNNNNQYEVSKEAAERIVDEIKEINYAYVLTTNNNAYVAATMDNHNGKDNNNDMMGNNNKKNNNNRTNRNNKNKNNVSNMNNNNDNELADDVKEKISDIVQSVDGNIDNVFVSTNPDFVELTNNYRDNLDNGRPVRGFFDQMGNMIERVFPQNKR